MSVSFRLKGDPQTAAAISTVAGAWLDGGQVVIRRQVREGFGNHGPDDVRDVSIEISCRQESESLLSVVKNIIDGLDEHRVIHTDRDVYSIRAVFDEADPAATVIVAYGDFEPSPGMQRKYPSGGLLAASSETLAMPVGARPLIAPSGEATSRDIEAYVGELLGQWSEVAAGLDAEVVDAIRLLPQGGPCRLTVIVASKKTADLENVVGRVMHLVHVAAHASDEKSAHEVWDSQPAIEDLVTEIDAYRADLTPVGLTITFTPIADTTEPLLDLDTIRSLTRGEVPLPQIELASDSPRLGQRRKRRGPVG